MRKSTTYHYSEGDVRKIIRDELELAKTSITESVSENLTQKIATFKDQIVTLIDKVMGELETIRNELTLINGRVSQDTDQLENHEIRITKLEQTPTPA